MRPEDAKFQSEKNSIWYAFLYRTEKSAANRITKPKRLCILKQFNWYWVLELIAHLL